MQRGDSTVDAEKLRVAELEHTATVRELRDEIARLRRVVQRPSLATASDTTPNRASAGVASSPAAGSATDKDEEIRRLREENVELRKFVLAGPPPPTEGAKAQEQDSAAGTQGADQELVEELRAELHLANARVQALRQQAAQQQPQGTAVERRQTSDQDAVGTAGALRALEQAADVARLEERVANAQRSLEEEKQVSRCQCHVTANPQAQAYPAPGRARCAGTISGTP